MSQIIETDADKLLELVDERKIITSYDAAKTLNVKENLIRKWAFILERNKLIKLKLGFFNLTLISKTESAQENQEKQTQ